MITLRDLVLIWRVERKRFIKIFLFSFFLFTVLAFFRYPLFLAKGSFQDSPISALEEELKLVKTIQMGKGKALVWMKSQRTLEKAASLLYFDLVLSNNRFYMAYLSHFKPLTFQKAIDYSLSLSELKYPDTLKVLEITPLSERSLKIRAFDKEGQFAVPGRIEFEGISFVASAPIAKELILIPLRYQIAPIHKIASNLKKRLSLSQNDQDRSVVNIMFKERSRKRAEKMIDGIMLAYQERLKSDMRERLNEQIALCKERKKELLDKRFKDETDLHALSHLSSLVESLTIKSCLSQIEPRPIEWGRAERDKDSFSPPLLGALLALFISFSCVATACLKRAYRVADQYSLHDHGRSFGTP